MPAATRRSARLSAGRNADEEPKPPPVPSRPAQQHKRKSAADELPPASLTRTGSTRASPSKRPRHMSIASPAEKPAPQPMPSQRPLATPSKGRRPAASTSPTSKSSSPPPRLLSAHTPSAVRLIAEPSARRAGLLRRGTGGTAGAAVSSVEEDEERERPADPTGTNATLLSPETSRVVTPRGRRSESAAAAPECHVEGPTTPSKATVSKGGRRASGVAKAKVNGEAPTTDSKLAAVPATAGPTTTANILEKALAHLVSVDARMAPLIAAHHCHIFSPAELAERIDPFESLASGIISQQVSGAAARAIKARFIDLFAPSASVTSSGPATALSGVDGSDAAAHRSLAPRRFPHPSEVAACPLDRLRSAGLSQRKAEYVQGLAAKFASGELSAQMLADAPYEEVLERLTAVRGLGRWSVEMFACFGLKRLDVFSVGDLGVQRGMAAFMGRDVGKLKNKGGKWKYMTEKEMIEIADRFRPYRSVFMWYMWRVEATDVSSMEKGEDHGG